MTHILFVHGGPGSNTNAEANLIGDKLGDNVTYWNEPSAQRGDKFNADNAYNDWYDSLASAVKDDTVIVAHCFGCLPAMKVAKNDKRVKKLVLITPSIRTLHCDSVMFRHVGKLTGDESLINADASKFNPEAFGKLAGYPELGPLYWVSKEAMANYYRFNSDSKWQMDIQSFMSVRSTNPMEPMKGKVDVPCLVLFADKDWIVRQETEEPFMHELMSDCTTETMNNAGHYPHIEDVDGFVERVRSFMAL